jgi:high frequency lysogenization protein
MIRYTDQERDRTIALAAVMQAVHLVHVIANEGSADPAAILPLLNSLLVTEADSTETVYGGLEHLDLGLEQLHIQLVKTKTKHQITQIQYAVNLLRLERKLAKADSMMSSLTREIDQLPQHIEYFDNIEHPQVIARLADIYKRTISNLTPFIQVYGEEHHLEKTSNANLIRALLLAGIRSAIIWNQKGGRYWQFLYQSKKITAITDDLRSELSQI